MGEFKSGHKFQFKNMDDRFMSQFCNMYCTLFDYELLT